jgi:hypothetical protein
VITTEEGDFEQGVGQMFPQITEDDWCGEYTASVIVKEAAR